MSKKEVQPNKETAAAVSGPSANTNPSKLGVFEEDDYFEEFDDEEFNEVDTKEDIDFKQWQEDWEDEEINDQFEAVLRKEMENFKSSNLA